MITLLALWGLIYLGACSNTAPETDEATNASGGEGCTVAACHGGRQQRGVGIEDAHPGRLLQCTDCHGGDGTSIDKAVAHVFSDRSWVAEHISDEGSVKRNISVDQLDDLEPEVMRFINPGDHRVAQTSCGSGSPAAGGGGCHQGLVDTATRSIMATFAGHFAIPRFQAGMQGRSALLASKDVRRLAPGPLPKGAVMELQQASTPSTETDDDKRSLDTLIDHYLVKNCTSCHNNGFGHNDAHGNYRSSGCTACHMVYDNDGKSRSNDPALRRAGRTPPHPARHVLSTRIPSTQCEHCHYQGARIGLHYRGLVEDGFATCAELGEPDCEHKVFEALEPAEAIHDHPSGFYRHGGAEFPADLHYSAGMSCADCHVGRDVHGDGNLYSTAKFQVSIRCENCHGNIDRALHEGHATAPLLPGGEPDPECQPIGPAESFLNCNGDPLNHLRRTDAGIVLQLSDGQGLPVTQIHTRLQNDPNSRMARAMGRSGGRSHTETLECTTCHTAYRQYCFGCHVEMEYGLQKSDLLSGRLSPGAERPQRAASSLDLFFVGINRRGKIGSFCPSMQVFLTAQESGREDGMVVVKKHFEDRVRSSAGGKRGFNWAIDTPHVVSTGASVQPCTRCHCDRRAGAGACDTEVARESFGFGTGRFTHSGVDAKGVRKNYDLTQLLDPAGEPLVDFSHEGQGAVPRPRIEHSLAIGCDGLDCAPLPGAAP